MAAEDHLSDDQFEIVHPHRSVRIGGRNYPAAKTLDADLPQEGHGVKAAWIPMENGQLLRVAHFRDEPGKFYMHTPMKEDAHKPDFRGTEFNHPLPDQHGVMRPFLKVHGAEMASKMIDAESTRPLKAVERADAHRQLQKLTGRDR